MKGNSMNKDKIIIRDLFVLFKKYFFQVTVVVLMAAGFSVMLTQYMPKNYRVDFELNVYSKYFQNPLISGIIPGVYSVPEMRFAIDSMVKEAINDVFIDKIGNDYNFYSDTEDPKQMATERQFLRDRFSYYSTGGQGYKISFVHSDPLIGKEIAEKTLKLVKGHFIQTRINQIEMVKEVMVRKLQSFNATQNVNRKGADNALLSKNPKVLNAELSKLNKNLQALKKQYKDNHPKIFTLKQKRATIKGWLKEFSNNDSKTNRTNEYDVIDTSLAISSDRAITEKISSRFYTKYHDFNIALEIEKRSLESYIGITKSPQLPTHPISPKRKLFASVGFLLGLVFSFIYVFFKEFIVPSKSERIALEEKNLNALFLGTLTKNDNKQKKTKNIIEKQIDIDQTSHLNG
jgi:hypothetical protein